jgi:hypothetical protein
LLPRARSRILRRSVPDVPRSDRPGLSSGQQRFLLQHQLLLPAAFNLALNALAGWLVFRHVQPLPLFPAFALPDLLLPNFAGDTFGMFFVLPFATCLVATPMVRRAVRDGKVDPLALPLAAHPLLRALPKVTWRRAMLFGLAGTAGALPVVGVLLALGLKSLPLDLAVTLKSVFAAVLAALVTPPIALYALAPEPV